ncbi:MAG TPA: RNA 3'-terminal phosphate cyclase [Candidatus Methanofastidiosa archaeon]|nr:RNA 3'-terminal phosphate cyclase [Candidatus Methanofastidiosa archaeon]
MMALSIDGSHGEGGGQILRTSIGLSALTGRPIRVHDIRSGRPNPGLRAQHLSSLKAMERITSAMIEGAHIGSTEISFAPGRTIPGDYMFDIGTAGSVTLLMHSLIPPLLFSEGDSMITVTGGTDVPWSPTTSYYQNVSLEAMRMMGIDAYLEVERHGYYPMGGGRATLHVGPWARKRPLGKMRFKEPDIIYLESCSHGLGKEHRDAQTDAVRAELGGFDIEVVPNIGGHGHGNAVTIWAKAGDIPLGHCAIGRKGYGPGRLGTDAARKFKEAMSIGCCDEHLPDQLIPLIFLSGGKSSIPIPRVTGHLETNLDVAGAFLDARYEIKDSILKIR